MGKGCIYYKGMVIFKISISIIEICYMVMFVVSFMNMSGCIIIWINNFKNLYIDMVFCLKLELLVRK